MTEQDTPLRRDVSCGNVEVSGGRNPTETSAENKSRKWYSRIKKHEKRR